ncbi:MAG: nickel pincer cofactor biosynthesis protein LarC [Holophagales bacterium]|jgi:uncharacterized protein (TIGR00299 family) protein|nr:nickel pincer cofactor biosynthesis protein LarC [Holophagales bacterium]
MKTLYLECNMGAAGDMLMAALLELHDNPADFTEKLNKAGIHGVRVFAAPSEKCGITGTRITVTVNGDEEYCEDVHGHSHGHEHTHANKNSHDHGHSHEHKHSHEHGHPHEHKHSHGHGHSHGHDEHRHSGLHDIKHLIGHLNVSDRVKQDSLAIYNLIAEAESHAHGVPVTEIHFHEVGNMDAVADIVGVCMLMESLAPERVLASPVHVGSGQVRCSHGVLPVPAPATAHILRGVPIYGGAINGELCTPTGAAILKHFVSKFGAMPVLTISKTGYGMGRKNFESANCVRAFIGQTNENTDEVTELTCSLDDMTPEAVAFVQELLFDEGALDVYTMPIGMKKGRIGIMFTCMCENEQKDKMLSLIFKHTTTLGIRENISRRYTLHREQQELQTKYGTVRVKSASGYGITKSKPEYEDIAKIARKNELSLPDVLL